MVLTLLPTPAMAEATTSDIVKYEIENGISFEFNLSTGEILSCTAKTVDTVTSINIPNVIRDVPVRSIGDQVFAAFSGLTNVTIPYGIISIGNQAFHRCSLSTVDIPDSVTSIGEGAFYDCRMKTLTIPSSVKSIGNGAFSYCSFLTTVTILSELTDIADELFSHCYELKSINIPNSVTSIGWGAFWDCMQLENINIPNGVTLIRSQAFMDCSQLKNITIPNSIVSIGASAFARCDKLTDVYYTGAEAQWNAILIEDYNKSLTSAAIHYGSGDDLPADTSITRLYPANGSTFDHTDATADTRMRIFFDREVSNAGGNRPELDFDVGTLEIHKSSDDSVVYRVQYGTEISQWSEDGSPTAVVLQNASSKLDYGTEYYVTMPAGFIKMVDGSSSPALGKGDWQFTTKGNGSDPTPSAHSFTYMPNGGTMDIPYVESHMAGDQFTLAAAPVREGYQFKGWVSNTTTYQPGDTFTMPDQDVILVAAWQAIHYLTYNYGGVGPYPATSHAVGETISIPSEIPVREGYVFTGWSDGSTTYQPGDTFGMPGHDVTLTAIWTEIQSFHVHYNLNGGTGNIPAEQHAQGETVTVTSIIPTHEGYYFGGWSDSGITYQPGTTFSMPNHDVTLTAIWTNISAEMQYVQYITKTSLAGVERNVRTSIQNGIYNLLFKATFRPTAGPEVPGINATFTDSGKLQDWYPQNYHYAKGIRRNFAYDGGLAETVTFSGAEAAGGCKAYALFAMSYIYGKDKAGDSRGFNKASTLNDLQVFLETYMLPGAMIYYNHANGNHAIVYLGEDEGKTGFYYISYEGGSNGPDATAYHQMTVKFDKFEEFYKKFNYFYARDQRDSLDAARTIIRVECPVEARVTLGNEVLDSRNAPASSDFGTVRRDGEAIIFDLQYSEDYRLEIIGTGEGFMDLTLEYQDENGDMLNTRGFKNIPIENDTQIDSYGLDASGVFILYQNLGEDDEKIWGASVNQTVSEPDDMYSSKYNAPDLNDGSSNTPIDPTPPSKPSAPSSPWNPIATNTILIPSTVGGKVSANPSSAKKGQTVTLTAAPDPGYELTSLTVTDTAGKNIELSNKGSGQYTFTMPNSQVSINAVFQKIGVAWNNPFTDVFTSDYYYEAVQWAVANGITNGTNAEGTLFSPNAPCTRAQIVTFLWRAYGKPAPTNTSNKFTDVETGSYYYDAMLWAVENGITNGTNTEGTKFSPNEPCTRAQAVTFQYRAAKADPMSGSNSFTDVAATDYFANAVQWAVSNGITNGTNVESTRFSPNNTCTRGQIVTFLHRALAK